MARRAGLLVLLAAACATPPADSNIPDAQVAILDAPLSMPDGRDAGPLPGGGDGGALLFDPCVADPQPGYDPGGLTECCQAGPAHCVPSAQIPQLLRDFLTDCPGGGECMPDPIIRGGGEYRPPSCTSTIAQAPGACLSKCIPLVADNPLSPLLRQDGCGQGEVCAPCTNPLDSTPTGACELIELLCPVVPDGGVGPAPDAGVSCPHTGPPILDPQTLAPCAPACGGAHCVPATVVPAAQQPLLAACTAGGDLPGLCAPDVLIVTGGNFIPRSCTSVAGAEGRCLSRCLPDVAEQAALLPRDVCSSTEKCVPCFDPTAIDPSAPTGACDLACDQPTRPPVVLSCPWTGPDVVDPATLPQCSPSCGGAHCVPGSLVPDSLQNLLATCAGGFCAPDTLIRSGAQTPPPRCTSIAGVEGRCLSTCLPDVAEQVDLLPRDTCAATERCVPCFDPTSAEPTAPTGACDIACDDPNDPPTLLECPWEGPPVLDPARFPACDPICGGAHCVPEGLVPAELQDLLASCPGGFCTPDPFIETAGNFVPATCSSVAGAEGRCLSTCLPEVAGQEDLLPRDVCGANERCVPCFDPTAEDPNEPTGACTTSCDVPKEPPLILTCPWTGDPVVDPAVFPPCEPACGGAHCVPADLIPEDQRELLAACPGGYCAPDDIIETLNNWVPKECSSLGGAEGRCLSRCLPLVAELALFLPSVGCAPDQECVPCYDPTAPDPNTPTGACSLACDAPAEPPLILACPYDGPAVIDPDVLEPCDPACGGAHCLPGSFVPEEQRHLLAPCPGGYCTPDPMIRTVDNWNPQRCTSVAGAEGRCLSTCLPLVAGEELLPQSTCPPDHRCVPCFDPTAEDPTEPTGACGLGCDEPNDPPVLLECPWRGPAVVDPMLFDECEPLCAGAHCLPAEMVDEDQRDLLAPCPGGYCTPDDFIATAGQGVPQPCTAFHDTPAEGRCLSECLPLVASQDPPLEQSSCPAGARCAPCFDPLSGLETGACDLACDDPNQPPYTFPACCYLGDGNAPLGRCVPRSQIPDGDEARLEVDACPPSDMLCAPNSELPGGQTQACETFFYSGTCVFECINTEWYEDIFLAQGNCPTGHLCVP
jgi:hypothetical protein